jgi:hypothetical protein
MFTADAGTPISHNHRFLNTSGQQIMRSQLVITKSGRLVDRTKPINCQGAQRSVGGAAGSVVTLGRMDVDRQFVSLVGYGKLLQSVR